MVTCDPIVHVVRSNDTKHADMNLFMNTPTDTVRILNIS